ncbi:hypothetical protein AHAS_Ahas03G0294800 [Arachis hypogaea]
MMSRLSTWKARNLSLAGRVTLTQSTLASIPTYIMQTMRISLRVCDKIDSICRSFVWGGNNSGKKIHLLSWKKLCSLKKSGGLGFRSARMMNDANLMKLAWKLIHNRDSLWVQVLCSKYRCGDNTIPLMKPLQRMSNAWKGISHIWKQFERNLIWRIGSGQTVDFWKHHWIPEKLIKWQPPPPPFIKLNSDGSVSKNGRTACDGILRDSNGQFLACYSANLGARTMTAAEFWGILFDLELIINLGHSHVEIEVDSAVAVQLCSQDLDNLHAVGTLVSTIKIRCNRLSSWTLHHEFREANSCADKLASFDHSLRYGCHFFFSLLPCISLHFFIDAVETVHSRIISG